MATFLGLCQRVRQECGVAGTGPVTVVGQVNVLGKIVDRTAHAWVDIQAQRPCWAFLRNRVTFSTVIGQREYGVVADLLLSTVDKWDKTLSYLYLTSTADERALEWVDYPSFRRDYRTFPAGRPSVISEGRDGTIQFERTPDAVYTVTLDYWMTPELLALDSGVPSMPAQYHDAILWKSVMAWAGNETASELYVYAKSMYDPIYQALVLDQGELPTHTMNYPLACGDAGRSNGPFPRP